MAISRKQKKHKKKVEELIRGIKIASLLLHREDREAQALIDKAIKLNVLAGQVTVRQVKKLKVDM